MVENTLALVEPLAVTDRTTLVPERIADGKIRVISTPLVEDEVILADQVPEIRSLGGRIRIARKERQPDVGDPRQVPSTYDSYKPTVPSGRGGSRKCR